VANESTSERIAQVRRRIEAARDEIGAWFKIFKLHDQQRQYETQLATLKSQIYFLLGKLQHELDVVDLSGNALRVYAHCRILERRLLWVYRLWSFFQSKFSQRQDPKYQDVLAAADEIIWSCYMQPFRAAKVDKFPPHPLPFVASAYSPYAIPREEPPVELRSDVDVAFLTEMLERMPIPVTGIQSLAVDEPWWLAYLAHEAGHHVQFDFNGGSLIGDFGKMLHAAGGSRWADWCKELFADVYSLLMIGPWALWALAELIWGDAEAMLDDSNPRYPSPLLRLIFMKEVANNLCLDGNSALRGFVADDILTQGPFYRKSRDLCETAEADLKVVERVAKSAVEQSYVGFGTLKQLVEFKEKDFTREGDGFLWGEVFSGRAHMIPVKEMRSARLVLSGGIRAWSEILDIADAAERGRRRVELSNILLTGIRENREEITREATPQDTTDLDRRTAELADLLFSDRMPGTGW
jgi:hypothetical protein